MAQPSDKSPGMNLFLDMLTEKMHGRCRTSAIMTDTCVACKGPAVEFKDDLSKKEFTISGLCQVCQDGVFE